MANIRLQGIGRDPTGEFDVGAQYRFTHDSTTGETTKYAQSLITIPPNGAYDFTLEYGLIFVEYKTYEQGTFKHLGVVTVNQDQTARDIPALLNAMVPPTNDQLLEFQRLLAEANQAAAAAKADADRAEAAANRLDIIGAAMSRAEFEAIQQQNIRETNGSGNVEWGKSSTNTTGRPSINEGLWTLQNETANRLCMGHANGIGVSRTDYPIIQMNGVRHRVEHIHTADDGRNYLQFAPAEDGRNTVDLTVNPAVVRHASVAAAFTYAAADPNRSVLTSRQDLAMWEQHYEVIGTGTGEKDVIFIGGIIQSGLTTYKGIPLVDLTSLGIDADYAKFYVGQPDGDVISKCVKFSTLTQSQLDIILQDYENNIFYDKASDRLIQVRLKARTPQGLGNAWNNAADQRGVRPNHKAIQYGDSANFILPKGQKETITSEFNAAYPLFHGAASRWINETDFPKNLKEPSMSAFGAVLNNGGAPDTSLAWEGKCFAMPICLVQRGNSGAFHEFYNPEGAARFIHQNGTSAEYWYANIRKPTSKQDCFIEPTGAYPWVGDGWKYPNSGNIGGVGSGRHDQYLYFDAIYAGAVPEDLRLSCNRQDHSKLKESSMAGYVDGSQRGKGKVPVLEAIFSGTVGTVENYGRMRLTTSHADLAAGLNLSLDEPASTDQYCVHIYNETQNKWSMVGLIHSTNGIYLYGDERFIPIDTTGAQPWSACEIPALGYKRAINYMLEGMPSSTGLNYYSNDSRVGTGGFCAVGDTVHFIKHNTTALTEEYDGLPWNDILGIPEEVRKVIADNGGLGVVGQWLPYTQNGGSTTRNLSRKCSTSTVNLTYLENGVWHNNASWAVDNVNNTVSLGLSAANNLYIIKYNNHSATTQPTDQLPVVGKPENVFSSEYYTVNYGNRLMPSLTGSIGKSNPTDSKLMGLYGVNSHLFDSSNGTIANFSDLYFPTHNPIDISAPNNDGAAFKTMYNIVVENGLEYFQFNFSGMQYNGTVLTLNNITMSTAMNAHPVGSFVKMTDGPFEGFYRIERLVTASPWQNIYNVNSLSFDYFGNVIYTPEGSIVASKISPFGWGDNGKIAIVNRDGVSIDLNNNRNITGTHRGKFPIGIHNSNNDAQER